MPSSSGQNRAVDGAKAALASPLLDVSIEGSKAVRFSFVGGNNLSLFEVNQAADVIKAAVDPDANIIFGVANDPAMENDVRITLITTGFHANMGMGQAKEDDELTNLLKSMRTEDELDMPSFLRRPLFNHRRQQTPVSQPQKNVAPAKQRHFL